jgi:hypothetical protein
MPRIVASGIIELRAASFELVQCVKQIDTYGSQVSSVMLCALCVKALELPGERHELRGSRAILSADALH